MQVNKENRAFMYKRSNGRFVVHANIDGEQKRIVLFPNIGEDGMSVDHWAGNVHIAEEEQDNGN